MQSPDPKFIAAQLRRPQGDFAIEIATFMAKSNRAIYELTYDSMHLKDQDVVLEIGPADASFLDMLFAINENISYTGVDFSEEMVNAAMKKNGKWIESGNAKFIHQEIDDYTGGPFDLIFTVNTIYFWPDTEKTLLHLKNLLKPDGKLIIALRSSETMVQLPFSEHGFKMFDENSLTRLFQKTAYRNWEFRSEKEVIKPFGGPEITLRNICAIASH